MAQPPCMWVNVKIADKIIPVACGEGTQNIKWLGHVGIARFDEVNCQGWMKLGVPKCIRRGGRDGVMLDLNAVVKEQLKDGETVFVEPSISLEETDKTVLATLDEEEDDGAVEEEKKM